MGDTVRMGDTVIHDKLYAAIAKCADRVISSASAQEAETYARTALLLANARAAYINTYQARNTD